MASSGSKLTSGAAAAANLVRQNRQSIVLPELLEKGLSVPRWQAIALLKELADAGYGTFILGRKGAPTRLEKSPLALDRAGIDDTAALSGAKVPNEQTFLLQRPSPFKLIVPADLTAAEAERISRWLKAIAIDA